MLYEAYIIGIINRQGSTGHCSPEAFELARLHPRAQVAPERDKKLGMNV